MNAAEVREALQGRWPDSEYLRIDEAPEDAARQGRKIDVLVFSLWASRGFERDAVEIKVSYPDWKRELDHAAKADWWWNHVHRFWVAVPDSLAARVQAELPSSWGLLSVGESRVAAVVKAPKHDARPLPWQTVIGVLRTAHGGGWAALNRAEARGRSEGHIAARRELERTSGDAHLRAKFEQLTARVAAFAQASGFDIGETWGDDDAARLGHLAAVVLKWLRDPSRAGEEIRRLADQATGLGESLEVLASELGREFRAQAVSAL